MRVAIEGPTPFRLDHPLPGLPVALLGANDGDILLTADETGRALRAAVSGVSIQGTHVMNVSGNERVTGALVLGPDAELLVVSEDGYGKRIPAAWVPLAEKPNVKGRGLISRRPLREVVARHPDAAHWVVTATRLARLDLDRAPVEEALSLKAHRLVKLTTGEAVGAVLQVNTAEKE
jgi:hypothetical protein